MHAAGHPYKDPGAARAAGLQPGLKSTTDKAFQTERAIAIADATCARDTALRAIGNTREAHYVNTLRDKYGDALDNHARLQREALMRAIPLVPPRT
jgi:hypothetical protein